MKIYTRKGDKGETSLIGGERVKKSSLRINAYGTVDELNSFTGIVRDMYDKPLAREALNKIQNLLFIIGSHLASGTKSKMTLPELQQEDVDFLEHEMDRMNEKLPELMHFILPGGHVAVSHCHVARCVCRRAERLVVDLDMQEEVEPLIIQYLNRLSDYYFVLSRMIAFDMNAEEVKWIPR